MTGGAIVGALMLVAVSALAQKPPAPPDYNAFIATAKDALTREFIDPGSVQYRDLFVSVTPNPAEDNKPRTALCGEVNSKNRLGGYVGFRRFVVWQMPSGAPEVVTGDTVDTFWGVTCAVVTKRL